MYIPKEEDAKNYRENNCFKCQVFRFFDPEKEECPIWKAHKTFNGASIEKGNEKVKKILSTLITERAGNCKIYEAIKRGKLFDI